MPVIRLIRFSFVVALGLACSTDAVSAPFRGFSYSAAAATCGPTDGPAVAIYLSPNPVVAIEPDAPFVRVFVPVTRDQLTGRVWPIKNGDSDAVALFHPDGSTYEVADTGYLIVTSIESDNTVTGSLDLRFPDSGHIKTAFRAAWVPIHFLCG